VTTDIHALMTELGQKARAAARQLALVPGPAKDTALRAAAATLRAQVGAIKDANAKDMAAGEAKGLSKAMLDRLMLNDARIEAMAAGLEVRVGGAAHPHGAGEVGVHDGHPLLIRHVLRQAADIDASVVDQDVEPPKLLQHLIDNRLHILQFGHIAREAERASARLSRHSFGDLLHGREPSPHQHNIRASLGQRFRKHDSQPTCATCDQRYSAIQPKRVE